MDHPGPLPPDGRNVWPPGWHVRHVDVTGSTNADLLADAARGAPSRSVLFTDHQTAGRGRLDRRWDAPPGANLLVSFLFGGGEGEPVELMRRVAIAAIDACAAAAGVAPRLKWPNDILLDGSKLAGLLAQRAGTGGSTVIGLGLNVGWAPEGAAKLGEQFSPASVLAELLRAFDALGPDVHDRYVRLLATLGQHIRVELPGGEALLGRAIDVARDGRLIVLDECAITHRLDVGDVIHLRPA